MTRGGAADLLLSARDDVVDVLIGDVAFLRREDVVRSVTDHRQNVVFAQFSTVVGQTACRPMPTSALADGHN